MKNLLPKVLFYYCAFGAFFITISTVLTSQTMGPVIFATLFLPVTAYFIIEFFKQMRAVFSNKQVEGSDMGSTPKIREIVVITFIFLSLLGLGIKSIYNSSKDQAPVPVPSSSPLVFKSQPSPTPLATLTIEITDGSPSVNIREKPTVYSSKVTEAKNGDVFEYLEENAGWYKIKLDGDKVGYISAKYVKP
jgi:hypothetical protein